MEALEILFGPGEKVVTKTNEINGIISMLIVAFSLTVRHGWRSI